MSLTVPAADVRFGHEHPTRSMNVRVQDREADLEQLVASIKAEGLIQPMATVEHEGVYYVVDGNRRLAALKTIGKPIPMAYLHLIQVADIDDALVKGLQANVQRMPLHIVDRFEAFSTMAIFMSADAIANRFGIGAKEVHRALALGALSPKIRNALRKDEIALNAAEAFTLETDKKKQEALFNRLKKEGQLWAGEIRAAIRGEQVGVANLLKFVGRDEFLAAGGHLGFDLFADDDADSAFVSDYQLLAQMGNQKLDDAKKDVLAQGWAWASMAHELPADWDWAWKKHPKAKASEREKYGAVLIFENGELTVITGIEKPDVKKAAEKKAEKKKKAAPALSAAMQARLEESLLTVTRDALKAECAYNDLAGICGKIVASMITPDRPSAIPAPIAKSLELIRNGLNRDTLQEMMLKKFNAKDYFEKAPFEIVLDAIKEGLGKERREELATKAKGMVRKTAHKELAKLGWLPPQLRLPGYSGPGA